MEHLWQMIISSFALRGARHEYPALFQKQLKKERKLAFLFTTSRKQWFINLFGKHLDFSRTIPQNPFHAASSTA